ncbi:MAG: hypothetical protein KDJ75_04255 [Alphaproteobacteria bacterium]|nr:hypothetical protein [Alphaproteobacteria bacterium]
MSFQNLKNAWENRPKPIAGLSGKAKLTGSLLGTPVFPALHTLDDMDDFKGFWEHGTKNFSSDAKLIGTINAFFTALYFIAANGLDAHLVDKGK